MVDPCDKRGTAVVQAGNVNFLGQLASSWWGNRSCLAGCASCKPPLLLERLGSRCSAVPVRLASRTPLPMPLRCWEGFISSQKARSWISPGCMLVPRGEGSHAQGVRGVFIPVCGPDGSFCFVCVWFLIEY